MPTPRLNLTKRKGSKKPTGEESRVDVEKLQQEPQREAAVAPLIPDKTVRSDDPQPPPKVEPVKASALPPQTERGGSEVQLGGLRKAYVGAHYHCSWFTPDGRVFAAGGDNRKFLFWETATGKALRSLRREQPIRASAVSPDGSMFCVGGDDSLLDMYQLQAFLDGNDNELAKPLWRNDLGNRHQDGLRGAEFSKDGQYLVTVGGLHSGEGGVVDIWDPRTGAKLFRPPIMAGASPRNHFGELCMPSVEDGLVAVCGVAVGKDGTLLAPSTEGVCEGSELTATVVWSIADQAPLLVARNVEKKEDKGSMWISFVGEGDDLWGKDIHEMDCTCAVLWPKAGKLLRGTKDGCIYSNDLLGPHRVLRETGNAPREAPPRMLAENLGDHIYRMCFNNAASQLVIACSETDTFHIIDLQTFAVTHTFVHPSSGGSSVSWAPADDMIATGGSNHQLQVLHPLVSPEPAEQYEAPGDLKDGKCYLGSVWLWPKEGGKPLVIDRQSKVSITCEINEEDKVTPLPDGKRYALRTMDNGVRKMNIHDLRTGKVLISMNPLGLNAHVGAVTEDSTLIALQEMTCEVREVNTGKLLFSFADSDGWHYGLAFTPDNSLVAACGQSRSVSIREIPSGRQLHSWKHEGPTSTVRFDQTGERVAYMFSTSEHTVVVRRVSDGIILAQVVREGPMWVEGILCPYNQELVMCAEGSKRPVLFHTASNTLVWWSRLLPSVMSAGVEIDSQVRFVQDREAKCVAGAGEADLGGGQLWIRAGRKVLLFALADLHRAIEAGAFSAAQLISATQQCGPDTLIQLVERFPGLLNIRDADTGDTVLHYCAKNGKYEQAQAWLTNARYLPIPNCANDSALHCAISAGAERIVRVLTESLSSNLNETSGALLTSALQQLAQSLPHLMLRTLNAIEEKVLVTTRENGRISMHRAEVKASDTWLLPPTLWEGFASAEPEAREIQTACKLIALPDLAGPPEQSPFHAIVQHCDRRVYESRLLQLLIQYKWEVNVYPKLIWLLKVYALDVITASLALVLSTRVDLAQDYCLYAHLLVAVSIILQVRAVWIEVSQFTQEGSKAYFTSPWNLLNLGALLGVSLACAGHVLGSVLQTNDFAYAFVEQAGSLGVGLKWMGALDLLRCFSKVSPLVRMIMVIARDIVPFMGVLVIVVFGMAFLFSINMPHSHFGFGFDNHWFDPFLTTFRAVIGDFEMEAFETEMAIGVFIVFSCFVVILMLNLLIAIMGDSYEMVKEFEQVERLQQQAGMIVEVEVNYPTEQQFPRFLSVQELLEAGEGEASPPWEGIGGKIKHEMRAMESQLTQVRESQESLNSRMASIEGSMDTLIRAVNNLTEASKR